MEEYTKEKLKDFMKKKAPVDSKMFFNIIIAIIVLSYFILINLVNQDTSSVNNVIKIFTIIFLILTITIFEIAYRKDDEILAINGIETLVLTIHTLLINHILIKFDFNFEVYTLISSLSITSYYILKTLVMFTKARRRYLDSLSDISEIVKKEQPIKREARKRNVKEDLNTVKKEIKNKQNKEIKKVVLESKSELEFVETEEKVTKDTKEKKKTNKSKNISNKEQKRRGRPKKEVV